MAESHYKTLPKLVVQETNTSCWAAVLESWLGILPGRSWRPKQSELMDMYPDLTFADGSIKPKEFVDQIAPQTGMSAIWVSASDFTFEFLAGKLKDDGHLIIGYKESSRSRQGGHVVVCYGVGRPDGKNQRVSVMDPSKGIGFRNRELSFFGTLPSENSKILIGSPKAGLNNQYF